METSASQTLLPCQWIRMCLPVQVNRFNSTPFHPNLTLSFWPLILYYLQEQQLAGCFVLTYCFCSCAASSVEKKKKGSYWEKLLKIVLIKQNPSQNLNISPLALITAIFLFSFDLYHFVGPPPPGPLFCLFTHTACQWHYIIYPHYNFQFLCLNHLFTFLFPGLIQTSVPFFSKRCIMVWFNSIPDLIWVLIGELDTSWQTHTNKRPGLP